MDPDLSALDSFLAEERTDGYLFDTSGDDSDQYYVSGFSAPDGVVSLYAEGQTHIFTNELEFGRAKSESRADSVVVGSEYGIRELQSEYGPHEAKNRALAAFLEDHGVDSVSVSGRFPLVVADGLRDLGVEVRVATDDPISEIRAAKTDEEVEWLQDVQRANQHSMAAAEALLRDADVSDGTLMYDGEPLSSERVKEEIEVALLREGCALDETIVACGADAAEPHNRGSGPLEADEPIIIDIFPRDKETKYHGDMTRTFVKGEPSETAREWYDLTYEAFEAALDAVEPGATGEDVYDATCEVYENAGLPTLRANPGTETGFIHSTGHGVGLDVHEAPSVGMGADEELKPGHVITIEPGLYDPEVGGVRIEDMVVVTEDGYRNLTDHPIAFELD